MIQFNSIRPKLIVHIYICNIMSVCVCVCVCASDVPIWENPNAMNVVLYTHSLVACALSPLLCTLCCSQYDERAFSLVAVDSIVGWVCCVCVCMCVCALVVFFYIR